MRNIMGFIEFFEEDDSGDWREQLEEIRLRYPGTYEDYKKEKAVLPPTPPRAFAGMSSLLMDRKVAKYNKAVAAYDEWKSLHPNGAMLTSEEAARGDALERAMEREEPQECSDCGTYCDGNCPCDPEQFEWERDQQYRAILGSSQNLF